jgi:hypothetical protein
MSSDSEFFLSEKIFLRLKKARKKDGFSGENWDEWFESLLNNNFEKENKMDLIVQKFFYENDFEQWIKSFAINLKSIWEESSAKEISKSSLTEESIIIIGAGPSLKKHNHLEILAKSNFKGSIICTDRSLIPALKAGVTPEKFPNFYVLTIDAYPAIEKYYDDDIVNLYGNSIKGIFSVLTYPSVVNRARKAGVNIHWVHTLFDYNEGKKSFNQISALMIRACNESHKLPAIQTGGNVGTSAWFVGWKILKCKNVCLIGINHGWEEEDSIEKIISHGNAGKEVELDKKSEKFKNLFPKKFNPEFQTHYIMDPIFQYYSSTFKEFISRTDDLNTINATEGGSIFGDKITCMKFSEFLAKFEN